MESGADVYGSATTCLIAQSQGLSTDRCHVLKDSDQFAIGKMNVQVSRTIHWWPEQTGIGGAFTVLDDLPDPDELFIVPQGKSFLT